MTMRSTTIIAFALVLVGCGGGQQPPTSAASNLPGQSGAPATGSAPPVVAGEPIDTAQVQGAVDALKSQDSWQFEVTTTTLGLDGGVQTVISGTQTTTPENAIDASHPQPGGGDPFRYIRIGDSIWFDVGTGQFNEVQADEAENLIAQYEPYYLNALAESMTQQDFLFEPVGDETISGIATTHYLLSEEDRADVTRTLDIDLSKWAGDVWIAKDDGYAMRLAWGPQTIEDAQISLGFNYVVTAVNCECPIEPPV